jgi:hypothetical protein
MQVMKEDVEMRGPFLLRVVAIEMALGFSSLKSQISLVERDLKSQISRVERDLKYVKKDVENLEEKVDLFIGLGLLVNIASISDMPAL